MKLLVIDLCELQDPFYQNRSLILSCHNKSVSIDNQRQINPCMNLSALEHLKIGQMWISTFTIYGILCWGRLVFIKEKERMQTTRFLPNEWNRLIRYKRCIVYPFTQPMFLLSRNWMMYTFKHFFHHLTSHFRLVHCLTMCGSAKLCYTYGRNDDGDRNGIPLLHPGQPIKSPERILCCVYLMYVHFTARARSLVIISKLARWLAFPKARCMSCIHKIWWLLALGLWIK